MARFGLIKNLRKKKFWLSISLFLLLLSGLVATSVLVQRRQLMEKKAAEPTAILQFNEPTSLDDLQSGDAVDVGVKLDPGGQNVVGADLSITFPEDILELVSVDNTWAKTNTSFKALAPIAGEADCTFALDINEVNNTGKLEFGIVTFDCETALGCSPDDPDCAKPVPHPGNTIVNPIASLHFRVKGDASPGSSGTIEFDSTPGATDDTNVAPYVQGEETVDDILLRADSTVTVTIAGEGTPTPTPTPTIEPEQAQLTFQVKFQGINEQGPDKTVRITLKQGGSIVEAFENVGVTYDSSGNYPVGTYTGTVVNITPGTYDVLVKGWAHLQKKFENIELQEGSNDQNWSGTILSAGDFDNDNRLNITDIGLLLSKYTALSVPVDETNRLFDVDVNNVINISDIGLVLANYTALEVIGDE